MLTVISMLRGGAGSHVPSSEAGQRDIEAGRRCRTAGARIGGAADRARGAGALARAPRRRPRRRSATRLLQLRSLRSHGP